MAAKKEKKLKRMEAARELARLSGQVADGFLELNDKRVELPDEFVVKKVLKVKKNEISFEFSLKAREKREEGKGERRGSAKKQMAKGQKGRGRPYKAKRLKKEIGMLWKALKRCVKSGETFRDREGFLKSLDSYGKGAEEEWKAEWEKCVRLVREVLDLSHEGRGEEALEKCRQVDQLTKACHKRYK